VEKGGYNKIRVGEGAFSNPGQKGRPSQPCREGGGKKSCVAGEEGERKKEGKKPIQLDEEKLKVSRTRGKKKKMKKVSKRGENGRRSWTV